MPEDHLHLLVNECLQIGFVVGRHDHLWLMRDGESA
jgi:hypothetical protein